jgi:cell division transport system permease protein
MIFRNLKYFIVQGFKGLISNSLMTLASIGIVVASLVLLGVFVLLGMNLNSIGDQIKEQCEINVYVPNEMNRDNVRAIGSQLTKIPYVKEAQLYTKEERLLNYKEGIYQEQAEVIDTLEADNPLRDAYILSLEDVTKANEVAEAASQIEGVEEVVNRQDLIQKILSITNAVQHVSIWLMLILAAISVFIISNTIKLGMFSRRKEINIMKFVGATNWFIRWPFIVEGMLLGAVGAAVATVIVMFGYGSVLPTVQAFMGNLTLLSSAQVLNIIIIAFLIIGMGFGMLGSAMSIRKHLHV